MTKFFKGFTNNQLKILACISMFLDHVGKELFPEALILQIIGRIAFPIFAFMISEGCCYTRNKRSYFLKIAGLALGCQLVYFIAERSLYQNVLVTFSLAVLTIFVIEFVKKRKNGLSYLLLTADIALILFLCFCLPDFWRGFHIDYGFFGLVLPVAVYLAPGKVSKLIVLTVFLMLLSFDLGGIQWYSLLSVIIIALYNGKRGKINLKYLFYVFYPLHLALIYLIKILFF